MANEPNNAEEQLKQYAAERRQQVPGEIHPATRNLLQGEVRRTYGSPAEERRARLRLRWMQALAWLVVAAAIPLFFLPRNPKENVQEAGPTKPGEVLLPTEKRRGEAPIVLSDTKEPVAPVLVAPPTASAPATVQPASAKAELATRAATPQRARASEMVAAADAASDSIANNTRLMFANTISNQDVLNQFRLEQTGVRVKITETKDGSEYSGRVFSQAAGADSFQAAGFSRTLNQAVILTGQVLRAAQATAAPQQTQAQSGASALNNVQLESNLNNNFSNNNYENVRVQGQATIGNTQYKVDAQVTPGQ